jgi:sugar lactone lactonase YvrE
MRTARRDTTLKQVRIAAAGTAAVVAVVAVALLVRPDAPPPTPTHPSGSSAIPAAPDPAAASDPFAGVAGHLTLVLGDVGGPGNLPGRGTDARLGPIAAMHGEPDGALVYAPAHDARLVRIRPGEAPEEVFDGGIRLDGSPGPGRAGEDGPAALSRHGTIVAFVPAGDGGYYAAVDLANVIVRIDRDGLARTVAGRPGRRGLRDGPEGRSLLDGPSSLALARDGTLYVVDALNAAIRRLRPDGRLETVYLGRRDRRGGRANPDPARPEPGRIAIDGDGFLWMTARLDPGDARNNALYRLDATGRIDLVVGAPLEPGDRDGPAGEARFDAPTDLAADPDGELWVSEWNGHRAIRRVTRDGHVSTVARSPCPDGSACPALTTAWDGPIAPSTLGTGARRPFLSAGDGAVYRLEADGRAVPFAGRRACAPPTDGDRTQVCLAGIRALARHPDGALIAIDGDAVKRIGPDGRTSTLVGPDATIAPAQPPAGGAAPFRRDPLPAFAGEGLAVDASGRILFGLATEGVAAREPDGRLRLASHPDLPAPAGGPARPPMQVRGLALAADGRLLATEGFAVWRIDPDGGQAERLAGEPDEPGDRDGRGEAARFRMPGSVAVAADGTAYVADDAGLRRIGRDGAVSTAGLDAAGEALGACGLRPDTLAVAADGTLWFGTVSPPRVGRLRAGGTVEWVAGDRVHDGIRPGPLPGVLAPVRALLPTADGGVLIASGGALLKALPADAGRAPPARGAGGGCGAR